jgi:lysophospholipase L1-like esterase
MAARPLCAGIQYGGNAEKLLIGIIGDSNSSPILLNTNWPARVEERIGNPNITVQNFALAGSVAAPVSPLGPGYEHLTGPSQLQLALAAGVDFVVIRIGKNDVKIGTDPVTTHADIMALVVTAILGGIHPDNIRVYMISPFNDPFPNWQFLNTQIVVLNQLLLAQLGPAAVIDMHSFYMTNLDLYLITDGLHSSFFAREPCAMLAEDSICQE